AYTSEDSKLETCCFHPGVPIFHEGSKGWTCCRRRVLEFDQFLKIKGCKVGKHRFLDTSQTFSVDVQIKKDWYQTSTHVIISLFTKNPIEEKSQIQFFHDHIDVYIVYQ